MSWLVFKVTNQMSGGVSHRLSHPHLKSWLKLDTISCLQECICACRADMLRRKHAFLLMDTDLCSCITRLVLCAQVSRLIKWHTLHWWHFPIQYFSRWDYGMFLMICYRVCGTLPPLLACVVSGLVALWKVHCVQGKSSDNLDFECVLTSQNSPILTHIHTLVTVTTLQGATWSSGALTIQHNNHTQLA